MATILSIDIAANNLCPITYKVDDPQYSPLRVEPLLDQSIDILERALRLRAEYDALAVKLFDAQSDVDNLKRENDVQKDEDDSGYNKLPFQQSSADVTAAENYIDPVAPANDPIGDVSNDIYTKATSLKAVTQFIEQFRAQLEWAASREAGAMRGPFTADETANKTITTEAFWPMPYPPAQGNPNIPRALDWLAQVSADYQQKCADTLDLARAYIALHQATTQLGTKSGDPTQATGLYAKQLMDQKSAAYKVQRRQNLATQWQDKLDAIADANGPLNFQSAMVPLAARYGSDFGDAVSRVTQAAIGLQKLYRYDLTQNPLPLYDPDHLGTISIGPQQGNDHLPGPRFDQWIIWVRNAVNWLIRFKQTDQQIVVPVSVKTVIKDDWKNFKSGTITTLPLDPLPNVPDSLRNVRLRGISVFASFSSDADPAGPLQVIVTPPSSSFCIYQDDPTATHQPIPSQDKVRPCFAGRVLPRSVPQTSDLLGADDLYNAGPYGNWMIQMLSPKDAVGDLQDVEIDLLLVVQILGHQH